MAGLTAPGIYWWGPSARRHLDPAVLPMRSALLACVMAVSPTLAADWPQWRGPNRDGKSADTGLATAWPEGGPKLAWKLDNVGDGYGQVVVVGDKVYLIGSDGKKAGAKEFVLCLSAADGKEQWRTPAGHGGGQVLGRLGRRPPGHPDGGWRQAVRPRGERRPGVPGRRRRQAGVEEEPSQ